MNIVVLTAEGKVVVRPDTTWEKDNEDFYVPEFVGELGYSPVFYARICKPGRSVALKFAHRYYDRLGYGVLLYPEDFIDGSPEGYASALCLDHSSFLPSAMTDAREFKDGSFEILQDGNAIYSVKGLAAEKIEEAIAKLNRICYIRTGDLIAIELQPRKHLVSRSGSSETCIALQSPELPYSDFKIFL